MFGSILTISALFLGYVLLGFVIATLISNVVAFFYWFIAAKILLPNVRMSPRLYPEVWKNSFKFGIWQTIAQIGGLLANQTDRYVLGIFLSPAAVGIYNIALSIEQKAYIAVWRMGEVLFPAFSALEGENVERKAGHLFKSTWILTTIAVCALIPILPISHDLLRLWINDEAAQKGYLL